jgi:hypothetical protein
MVPKGVFSKTKRLKGFLQGFHVLGSFELHLDDLKDRFPITRQITSYFIVVIVS